MLVIKLVKILQRGCHVLVGEWICSLCSINVTYSEYLSPLTFNKVDVSFF